MTISLIGMNFVRIPAGSFMMGSPIYEFGRYNDEKQHLVHITKPFLLSITPVTQGQWQKVMGNNPSYFRGDDNLPVERVSWYDALEFCKKLSKQEGLNYRLPEWEYDCRAGTTTPFNTGSNTLTNLANYNHNKTTPVGNFPSNDWGLYDMHGNVWEWCNDIYAPYPEGEVTDPDQQDKSVSPAGRPTARRFLGQYSKVLPFGVS
jgi:formylglycine-generating enzyme required for sulfatase activity